MSAKAAQLPASPSPKHWTETMRRKAEPHSDKPDGAGNTASATASRTLSKAARGKRNAATGEAEKSDRTSAKSDHVIHNNVFKSALTRSLLEAASGAGLAAAVVDGHHVIQQSNSAFDELFGTSNGASDAVPMETLYARSSDWLIAENAIATVEPEAPILTRRAEMKTRSGTAFQAQTQHTLMLDGRGQLSARVLVVQPVAGSAPGNSAQAQDNRHAGFSWLSGGLAHDLANVLTVIRADLLASQDTRDITLRDRRIASALAGCDFATRMIDQLALFCHHRPNHPRPIDVAVVADRVQRRLSAIISAKITYELKPEASHSAIVVIDETDLERCLVNVATNAAEAVAPDGCITIAVTRHIARRGTALLSGPLATGTYVLVSIDDNGSGMPEAVRARALDPYFTTKPASQVRGFGLSLAYDAVRRIGGGVDIASVVGKGTSVRLYLPAASGARSTDSRSKGSST